jgi:aldose 1-epimerase
MEARVSTVGGALVDAHFGGVPIVRPCTSAASDFTVGKAASFPMVPFGNRVAGNAFGFAGRAYTLMPNTDWDAHYLHGDAWIGTWLAERVGGSDAALTFNHAAADGAPYAYRTRQEFSIGDDNALYLDLSVENAGDVPLPFGIGHHFFFPKTPLTTLHATATSYWTEKEAYLPDANATLPPTLDFSAANSLPSHWVNNGFEGWDGRAEIRWPEAQAALQIEASPEFGRYFVFVSSTAFEPSFRDDYFCFEPMSHSADAHHHPCLSGLRVLGSGERLAGRVTLRPTCLSGAAA